MLDQFHSLAAVEVDANKCSGAAVFRKTRVPVSALFENLRDGASINDFLEWFPGVDRQDVKAVLNREADIYSGALAE